MQAFSAFDPEPSVTITVQAPQSPSLQPSLVPTRPRPRSQSKQGPRRGFPLDADRRSVQQKRYAHSSARRGLPMKALCVVARCGVKRPTRPLSVISPSSAACQFKARPNYSGKGEALTGFCQRISQRQPPIQADVKVRQSLLEHAGVGIYTSYH